MTRYTPETCERALRMLAEALPDHRNLTSATRHLARMLGMRPEKLRLWQRQMETNAGGKVANVSEAAAEIKRGNAELRKANEILKAASVFFAKQRGPLPDRHDPVHRRTP